MSLAKYQVLGDGNGGGAATPIELSFPLTIYHKSSGISPVLSGLGSFCCCYCLFVFLGGHTC